MITLLMVSSRLRAPAPAPQLCCKDVSNSLWAFATARPTLKFRHEVGGPSQLDATFEVFTEGSRCTCSIYHT